MDIYWIKLLGIVMLVIGIVWIYRRQIPVGIEGRHPAFYIKGRWAILMGIIAILLGIILIIIR